MHSRHFAKTATATLALALVAQFTQADLEQRDSSQFDYKYEMIKLPTVEDVDGNGYKDFLGGGSWFTLGTGVDTGSSFMIMSGGQYLKADAASVGADGDVWRRMDAQAGASGTGYTVEARLKVTESTGSIGAMLLNASTGDSSINSWLVFRTDALYWGNGTDRKIMDIDATDWHDYRIVREPGSLLHSVFVDGTLVADDLPNGISATVNRIIMGSTGDAYKGKAQVAYLRFTKGAYAPPTPDDKSRRKASTDFPVQYEMNASDTSISTSGNASDWTISGASGATISKNGVLSVDPNGKNTFWTTTDTTWGNIVNDNTAFTVDFAAQIKSCTLTGGADRSLLFWAATPRAVGVLIVGMNHTYWQITSSMGHNILLDSNDNSDGKHVFRIAYDGATRHGFSVWRDGVKIGERLVDCTAFDGSNYNFVRFGKPGGNNGGAYDIDYIRWDTTGAYDWKAPPREFIMVIR